MRQRVLAGTVAALAFGLSAAASASAQAAQAQSGPAYTVADVQFMQGMIGHHAQAIVMAAMAPTHGASAQVSLFCRKIMLSQRDEIERMPTAPCRWTWPWTWASMRCSCPAC